MKKADVVFMISVFSQTVALVSRVGVCALRAGRAKLVSVLRATRPVWTITGSVEPFLISFSFSKAM